MSENPYRAPFGADSSVIDSISEDQAIVGVRSRHREDLVRVARLQQISIVTMIVNATCMGLFHASQAAGIPPENVHRSLAHWPDSIVSLIYYLLLAAYIIGVLSNLFVLFLAFFLAARFYHILIAMVIGLVSVFPGIGLVILFLLNLKARKVLRANGIPLGRLWAKP